MYCTFWLVITWVMSLMSWFMAYFKYFYDWISCSPFTKLYIAAITPFILLRYMSLNSRSYFYISRTFCPVLRKNELMTTSP